ncbi:MAG TPA: class I SAM-dependent methyltransferase, partial [Thermoanaerobaculia bacterium]|nr:class I SAM-dependent methyltransferase [Thermoanaerobaculia bacterium]
ILDAVQTKKVDLIVNLAAGLDARPWRLALPPSLHWVDVDLPEILAYKTETLRDEKPVCRYEAVTADLRDGALRRELFSRLGAGSARALVLSEGLLIYLPPEKVAELAKDLHTQPSFADWVIDIASPQLLKRMEKTWGNKLAASGAPFLFAPAEGTEFFRPCGWREGVFRSTWEEADRLHRTMKGAWFWNLIGKLYPKRMREGFRRFSGIVRLERA